MRTVSLIGAFALTFALLACAPADCDGPAAARPAAAEAAETPADGSALKTTAISFDVLSGGKSVGSMDWRAMEVRNKVVFQVRFEILEKDKKAAFESLAVYRAGERPEPERIQATTHLGTFKLMEGEVLFTQTDAGGRTMQLKVLGFADRDLKPFDVPRELVKEEPAPEGIILSMPAFLHFAPRLLPMAGRTKKIVHAEIPDDIDFPAFLNLKTDCVLIRGEWDEQGCAEIVLAKEYAGGNLQRLASLRVNLAGELVEAGLGNFVLRPAEAAPPLPQDP